jgi:hypothetical protein
MVLDASLRRSERATKQKRGEIHAMASLMGLAVNNPKEMPKSKAFIEGRPAASRFSSMAEIEGYARTVSAMSKARAGNGI